MSFMLHPSEAVRDRSEAIARRRRAAIEGKLAILQTWDHVAETGSSVYDKEYVKELEHRISRQRLFLSHMKSKGRYETALQFQG